MQPGCIIVFVLKYFTPMFSMFAQKLVSLDFVFVQIKKYCVQRTYF